jgi:peptidoglycan/xylan/chitin deacetylase (PgdA/CDA1 family)
MKNLIKIFNSLGWFSELYQGMATIFMLHRVSEPENNKLSSNENLKISPDFLNNFIVELKNNGYEFISLDELYFMLNCGKKFRKKIVFTLDDGYKDNITLAYPIFKKHNVPFTIYVTTGFIEQNASLWWYLLEDLILEEDSISLSDGQVFECKTKEQKELTFLKIREIILKFDKDNFFKNFTDLFKNYSIDLYSKNKDLVMNWNEVVDLSNDNLCTIGGHTLNHLALNKLHKNDVISEIVNGNDVLEKIIGKKIEHFAYPFGSKSEIGQREFDIVENLGLKTATTTRRGNIFKNHKKHLGSLPRIMLTENFKINEIGLIQRHRFLSL